MAPHDIARALHCSLDTEELRGCLDAAARERGASYSVLFPGEGHYSLFMGDPGVAAGFVGADARETLDALVSSLDHLAPISGEGCTQGVRAASPLRFKDEKYGLFLLHGAADQDLSWWSEVVEALSSELVKVQLYEAANHESTASLTKLDALNEAGDLVKYVELETLMTKLMELSIRIMHAEVGAIVLDRDDSLTTGIEWGLSEEILFSLRSEDGDPLVETAIRAGEPVFVADAARSTAIDTSALDVNLTSLILVPLVTATKRLGAIVVVNAAGEGLREDDAEVLSTIAALCSAAVENALLYEATREHERMSAEMNLASDIQASLLPESFEDTPEVEITGWCITASETGGDFYDYFDLGDGKTGIVIADATGHGMGAALIVFIARATLRTLLTQTRLPETVMKVMNNLVEADLEDDRFLTCFFGVLDRKSGQLTYCCAGHDPPVRYRPSTGEHLELEATGLPIGMFAGMDYEVRDTTLESGDFVLMGTDGIWEARNPAGEFYGKERLVELVEQVYDQPLEEGSERIRKDILDFHAGGERRDDITAVMLRMK
ncbi:MAG: hypothetical protein DHS20C21_20450 [Gemmatimonadota bacterium]|nr:MAG: hypothetical protein DHS20C21_20450 [Gemmatimonadota bacterium]